MQGNQRAALAANEHKPVKGADQDEALQLAFWRLHAGRKAWKDMHPTRPALVPGTLEFRKSILEKVFSDKELQAGQHTFMMTHGDNITMLDEMYRVRYFRIAHNVSLNQLARALGKVSRATIGKHDMAGGASVSGWQFIGICKLTQVIRVELQLFRWMMRQLMAELFIVATKVDVPLIKILQQNNVDGDQLTEDELVMYNFAVVSSSSSRPIVYSKKMLLEFKGNVDAVKRHITRHVETEYERLEETWTLGENQCDDVWTIEAMDILDRAYRMYFVETEVNKKYGRWDDPAWVDAMVGYERDIQRKLRVHWGGVSRRMTKEGQGGLAVDAVDQAMDKLEWLLIRRKLGRKWRVPLMSRSHFADMVDYFEQNGDAFRLVSVYLVVSV